MKQRSNLSLMIFLVLMYLAHPFISGYLAGLTIQKTVRSVVPGTPAIVERSLSGSTYQAVFWNIDAGGTVTIEIGIKVGSDYVYAPFPGVGPFTVTGGTPEFQPLFIPVAERVRVTYVGAGTGSMALLDS